MAKTSTKACKNTEERIFSAENALLLLARPRSLFDLQPTPDSNGGNAFISLDEVGRGCLAGPVVVGATLWSSQIHEDKLKNWYPHLRDSKKLSSAKRDMLFNDFIRHDLLTGQWENPPDLHLDGPAGARTLAGLSPSLRSPQLLPPQSVLKLSSDDLKRSLESQQSSEAFSIGLVAASIGSASAREIDTHGIIAALGLAASRALSALPTKVRVSTLFFDGNRPLALPSPWCVLPQILVVKGDDHLKSISASSVIAKVVRDRWMENYSKSFPAFGFDENRGYGTEFHREALSRLAPTLLHRISFLKNICPQLSP